MKTRKILALVMAVALLAISMTVVAFAEEEERVSAFQVYDEPTKNEEGFTDAECFDPSGLTISDGSTTIAYDTDSQYFTFSVELDQPLTVFITEIEVKYKGESCGFVPVVVRHHATGEFIPQNNHHHVKICDVCGVTCYNEEHTVEYWVPNGDASLIKSETESGFCTVCGDRVSRYIPETATYQTAFAEIPILVTILGLVASIVEAFALI